MYANVFQLKNIFLLMSFSNRGTMLVIVKHLGDF